MDSMASQLKFQLFMLMYLLIKSSPTSAAIPHNGLLYHPPAKMELLGGLSAPEMLLKKGEPCLHRHQLRRWSRVNYLAHTKKLLPRLTPTEITTRYTQFVQSATWQTSGRELDAGELADRVHYVYTNALGWQLYHKPAGVCGS